MVPRCKSLDTPILPYEPKTTNGSTRASAKEDDAGVRMSVDFEVAGHYMHIEEGLLTSSYMRAPRT
jgi:hypothetical protein